MALASAALLGAGEPGAQLHGLDLHLVPAVLSGVLLGVVVVATLIVSVVVSEIWGTVCRAACHGLVLLPR
jgi:hypothetical protein